MRDIETMLGILFTLEPFHWQYCPPQYCAQMYHVI